jgi:hypothetical protein
MQLFLVVLALAGWTMPGRAVVQPVDDPWGALRQLVGSWDGVEKGQPGEGRGERTYEFVLGGRYLHARNVSRFPPQPQNPKGEVHEDWKFFSVDAGQQTLALREFHIEGFVNYYLLDAEASSNTRMVFVSRHLENFDGRARYTVEFEGADAFVETFEVGSADKPLEVLVQNRWTRRR